MGVGYCIGNKNEMSWFAVRKRLYTDKYVGRGREYVEHVVYAVYVVWVTVVVVLRGGYATYVWHRRLTSIAI